jgi:hypothetical protein
MSELVLNAAAFASQAHRRINQLRRYSGQPYEVHLKSVAGLVESVIDDPEMIAAAWLHDVVEDTPATVEDVERAFGPAVAALVMELTDVSRPGHGNRGARVKIYREHLASSSERAKTIKLADLIDNCRDIVRHDPRFAPVYLAEMAALLDVLGDGDPRLYRKARRVLSESAARLGLGQIGESSGIPADALQDHEHALVTKHARTIGIFARTFCAKDIAEPFRQFDQNTPVGEIRQIMTTEDVRVSGVCEQEGISAYLLLRDFEKGEKPDPRRRIAGDQVVGPDASLADVIEILTRHDYCFVGSPGNVTGVIERADIQKPVSRMWLFGIITLLEMYFTQTIKTLWPDGSWVKLLTPRRLAAADQVRTERLRRDRPCQLIDCLQLADKGELLLQNPSQLAAFGFETRGAAKRVMKDIQSLRNNLAHAQDIVVHDWPQIVRLARRVEGMYRMTS